VGNGVVRTYVFIRLMESQTQYGFCSAKSVGLSSQKEPTQLCQEVVFPKRRLSLSCITFLKAVDNGRYADW
jgi:hypothetical protein